MRTAAAGILLGIELLSALYTAFLTWLLSSWFIDDSLAARLDTLDWYRIGGWRFAIATGVAGLAALLVYLANRFVLPRLWPDPAHSPRRLHWWIGALILLAGLVGSADFVIRRPYF